MNNQKKAIIAIFTISSVLLMVGLTGTTIAYIIDSYMKQGHAPEAVQQIMSLPAIFGLITSFLIGPLAMKINKKYLTMLCALCVFVYMMIFGFVGSGGPLFALYAATVFGGIAQGMAMVLTSSMIGEFVPVEKSATYVAISSACMNAGGAVLGLAGGWIAAGNSGANWPKAYFLGFLIIPALLVFAFLMPKKPDAPAAAPSAGPGDAPAAPPPPAGPQKLPFTDIAIGILAIFSSICICGFLFYISVYIVNVFKLGTSVEAGLANSIFTIVGVVTGFTYAIWAKLFKKMLIIVSFSLVALGLFFMMTFTTTLLGAFACAILMSWGFNMMNPYIMGFILKITPPRMAPVGMSFLMAGANMGMFVAIYVLDFLGGLLGGGLKNVLLVCTVGMVACTVVAAFIYREPKSPAASQAAQDSASRAG